MTRYRKCSAIDLQNRLQFINRHLETLNSIKRELLEESELRMELRVEPPSLSLTPSGFPSGPPVLPPAPPALSLTPSGLPPAPPVLPPAPPALIRQIASRPPSPPEPLGTPPEPVLQFLEEPDNIGPEDNVSLASNEINNIEQELKESLEKLSLAKMKKTLSRSKPTKPQSG